MRGWEGNGQCPRLFRVGSARWILLRMTIAPATFACMFALGVAARKMALAKDNPQRPSLRAMPCRRPKYDQPTLGRSWSHQATAADGGLGIHAIARHRGVGRNRPTHQGGVGRETDEST
jgi:hypothetical protein